MDRMTLVCELNKDGQLMRVYCDLPLNVVIVSRNPDGIHAECGKRDGPVASIPERVAAAVEKALDPYAHLTGIQNEKIADVAAEALVDEAADEGFLRSTMRRYVTTMTTAEQLATISSEPESRNPELGFDPETGKDLPEDEDEDEDEDPERLTWVKTTERNVWHVLQGTDEPKNRESPLRYGTMQCGRRAEFRAASVVGMDAGDCPGPSSNSAVCKDCVNISDQRAKPATT